MPESLMLAWAWLGPLQYLTVTLALLLSIDLWKKLHRKSWDWLMLRTPYALELNKAQELAHNLLIALPQVLGSALVAALVTGGDLKAATFAAIAGAGAPLTHHVKKWVESLKKPPGGGDQKPVGAVAAAKPGAWGDTTPPSLPGAAMRRWRHPAWRLGLLAVALSLCGCGLFTVQSAKTAQDIAHDLCVLHFQKEKPALSLEDVARTYCEDVDPWLDSLLGAEQLAAAKVRTKQP
jgi:hypothetical protein